jgi:hypothetical protein
MIEADSSQVHRGTIQSENPSSTEINTEGYVIPTVVPDADVSTLLAGYNPANIDPAIAQEIAKAVLDALQQATS